MKKITCNNQSQFSHDPMTKRCLVMKHSLELIIRKDKHSQTQSQTPEWFEHIEHWGDF